MKKKGFAFAGVMVSALAMVVGVSCDATGSESSASEQLVIDGGYGDHEINITIWAADAVCQTFASQAQAYADSVRSTFDIGFRVQAVGEDVSTSLMVTDVQAGADIYCYTQTDVAQLYRAGALAKVADAYAASVEERNDENSVACSKLNDTLYSYPLTSDNGYFMYYDKSVFPDQPDGSPNANLENMSDVIATLKNAGNKKMYFELTHGWYGSSYFLGAGCRCDWTTDVNGDFTSYEDGFDSEAGAYALMAGYELTGENNIYVDASSGPLPLKAEQPSAFPAPGTLMGSRRLLARISAPPTCLR